MPIATTGPIIGRRRPGGTTLAAGRRRPVTMLAVGRRPTPTALTSQRRAEQMGFEQYHEPAAELNAETRTFARMIASLTEEFKHFSMDLEFLARRTPRWRAALKAVLFQQGDIVELGEKAEEAEGL